MASKKIPMTPEIKEKLKRDIASLFIPKVITVESDSEPDHIFTVKLMNNIEFFSFIQDVQKCNSSDEVLFSLEYLKVGMKHIVPKIVEWTNDGSDYTDNIEEYVPFLKVEILLQLFGQYQDSMA